MPNKSGVHIVHTLGCGFGCIGVGLPDWGLFRGEGQIFQGGARFESQLGHNVSAGQGRFFSLDFAKTAESDSALARFKLHSVTPSDTRAKIAVFMKDCVV